MRILDGSRTDIPPTPADIADAAIRLAGVAVRTPLVESTLLNDLLGGRILFKAEMLQRTGAFKFRGAYNRISRIPEDVRARGVVTFSSGNHAQAVAAVAKIFGIPATIVMPADAPAVKTASTKAHGATVRAYDRATEDRDAIALALAEEKGATLILPFDDRFIMAGQGTAGLEIVEQAAERGIDRIDAFLAPCSGGGLVAGCATAVHHAHPDAELLAVEPDTMDDMKRSLEGGKRVPIEPGATSICDALRVEIPGELTFEVNRGLLAGVLAVPDDDSLAAMAAIFHHLKLVAEPGGAIAAAAVLSGHYDVRGKTVAVMCSGGNVDADIFSRALRSEFPGRPSPART